MTNEPAPSDAEVNEAFRQRRATKNKVTLALILGFVALIWAVTMIKMQHGG